MNDFRRLLFSFTLSKVTEAVLFTFVALIFHHHVIYFNSQMTN